MGSTAKQRKRAHEKRVEMAQLQVVCAALDWETLTVPIPSSDPAAARRVADGIAACARLRDAVWALRRLREEARNE